MSIINSLIALQLKIRHYKVQFILLFLFWFIGLIYFIFNEPFQNLWHLFLLSITVRSPAHSTDFGNFYGLVWPIFLEVIVFGFFIGELLEKYNPMITSRIMAKSKVNHTIIIGYDHLAMRIVDYCIEHKKTFVIIEDIEELVEDLISDGHPVVVGDPTEISNLKAGNVDKAKEVFICVNDVRISIICAEKIRRLNSFVPIYARVFEEHVQDYLKRPPLNVLAFSTSKWAMEEIKEWTESKKGDAIVIGRDNLTQRIAHHISLQPERNVYLFNDEHEGIVFVENPQLHMICKLVCFLSDIRPHVDFNTVSQAFICFKRRSEFDESVYLASKMNLRFPHIEIYVRIWDDELSNMVKRYNAKTFSSSLQAFRILQKKVLPNSSIFK